MVAICLYFQAHQPKRLRRYTVFDMYNSHHYEDESLNTEILKKVAKKCYLPTNALLEALIKQLHGSFKVAFCLSGSLIEQLQKTSPDTLASFQRLASTGYVEFLNETYYHSLSFIYSPAEFKRQVELHRDLIKQLFGQYATTFRNTELIYNNDLAQSVAELGYQVILAEGADKILCGRNANYVYQSVGKNPVKLLLKNYRLSDDIAFRFSDTCWAGYPLTASRYAKCIHQTASNAQVINLFMDYETFGEHQWEDKGIFEFLKQLPTEILKYPDFAFETPAEIAQLAQPSGEIDSPEFYSWADAERDLTAWAGNALQQDSLTALYALESKVYATKNIELIRIWQELQTSDHFYYMCTKSHSDGDVHKYFNPYNDPYEAYINYQNILADFKYMLHHTANSRFLRIL